MFYIIVPNSIKWPYLGQMIDYKKLDKSQTNGQTFKFWFFVFWPFGCGMANFLIWTKALKADKVKYLYFCLFSAILPINGHNFIFAFKTSWLKTRIWTYLCQMSKNQKIKGTLLFQSYRKNGTLDISFLAIWKKLSFFFLSLCLY